MAPLNTDVTGRDDWTVATFEITGPDGPREVTGMVRLWFGIDERKRGVWKLTHLPTGYAIGEARTEGQLVRAVAEVKGLISWGFNDPLGIKRQGAGESLRTVLRRHDAYLGSARPDTEEAA